MSDIININKKEILTFLNSWKDGVIDIGQVHKDGGDYKERAQSFIKDHYAFGYEEVLFKPTFTSDVVFRNNFADALSYFIKGHFPEDNGFALKPWKEITPSEVNILIEQGLYAVMGILKFQSYESSNPVRVVFTFVLVRGDDKLKIKIHHSSPID
jgi:hypothetical protein